MILVDDGLARGSPLLASARAGLAHKPNCADAQEYKFESCRAYDMIGSSVQPRLKGIHKQSLR